MLQLYEFVRGDTDPNLFEHWIYQCEEFEGVFTQQFYLEIISTDFRSSARIYELKQKLRHWLEGADKLNCQCITLANTDVVGMGIEEEEREVFKTFDKVKWYGLPLWWLYLYKCTSCQENWLVAFE